MKYDQVKAPKHYVTQSVRLQPIDVIRTAPFDIGNCVKYLVRAGHKGDKKVDMEKAAEYLRYARDSYQMNPKPYNEWWASEGFLVTKFKPFAGMDPIDGVFSFIVELQHGVLKNYFDQDRY